MHGLTRPTADWHQRADDGDIRRVALLGKLAPRSMGGEHRGRRG